MSPPRILAVDDEPELLQLMRYVLESSGFQVTLANNGREALAQAERETPDLVLCDVVMPELNGFETVAGLRARPETRDLPIIMVSARSQTQDVQRALNAGANAYITKPFAYKNLLAEIRRLLVANEVSVPTRVVIGAPR